MQFPLDPRKHHISKNRLKCSLTFMGLPGLQQTAGRVLGLSSGICMNDTFKQQQAEQP